MVTESRAPMATPQPTLQPSHRGAANPGTPQAAVSPPSKRELASWWKKFRKNNEKQDDKVELAPGIFGVPLAESIRYANVAISLTNDQGESFIYGYVPIVVAKCGVFLKEKATDVEGIFRLSGSAKRIKDLQTAFNSPDRYGKGLDWTGYTVHDAANIFRRYLNQLPEPIVPLEFYDRFRDPIRSHQAQAVGDREAQGADIGNFDHDAAVTSYQRLITELPPLNRQLLLYILDLLAVFASKSDLNRMNSANLAAIFQPGIISHPVHDMSPMDYRLSQDVLIFLIENQDNFLIGMTGTAVDEKTKNAVESGPPPIQSRVHSPKANIGRSASNASGGADSLRRNGMKRNTSVSSHNSRETGSNGVPSPLTPLAAGPFASGSSSSSVKRSNTVPSKKSPAITSGRFKRAAEPGTPASSTLASPSAMLPSTLHEDVTLPVASHTSLVAPVPSSTGGMTDPPEASQAPVTRNPAEGNALNQPTSPLPSQPGQTTSKERKISSLFTRSPLLGPSDSQKDLRQSNRLRKKRGIPGSANDSAQSSQNSLHGEAGATFHTPLVSPDLASQGRPDPFANQNPTVINTAATPVIEAPQPVGDSSTTTAEHQKTGAALQPRRSPEPSLHSRSSITDASDFDALDDPASRADKAGKRRSRWSRFSSSANNTTNSPLAPPPALGQSAIAKLSNSSIGSSNRPRKSFTGESQLAQQPGADLSNSGYPSVLNQSAGESAELLKESSGEPEKKGLFGKWKAKMEKSREEKKEREAEKERAKSPLRGGTEFSGSRQSLAHRGRSPEKPRDAVPVNTTSEAQTTSAALSQASLKPVSSDSAPQEATGEQNPSVYSAVVQEDS